METLIRKLKESSTWRGLTILASAVGIQLAPDLAIAIGSVAASVIGLIEVFRREKPVDKQ